MAEVTNAGSAQDFAAYAQSAVGDHATDRDTLGFAPYVLAVTAFLTSDATPPPLTLSIEGEWGSGKSSFLLQLESVIADLPRSTVFWENMPASLGGYSTGGSIWHAVMKAWRHQQRPTIRFNAWRHDKQDALWAAFALAVSQRLRQRIGFRRALWGDARLFVRRLRSVRGWMELLLAATSLLLLVLALWVVALHLRQHGWHHEWQTLHNLVARPAGKEMPSLYTLLFEHGGAAHGSWLGLLLLAAAGLTKFWDQVKLPIAFDLKKYLSRPDYEGHSAFIETFHEDFARLVEAYAGKQRVYIFIDDLDRCDVPRAAELMQAINLMISDAGNLIFVLGIDREKVAAGITQKYKDLLAFMPDFSDANGGRSKLAFGYSYLEKFIQLSFTLPVIAGDVQLEHFLNTLVPPATRPRRSQQLARYWGNRWSRFARLWWNVPAGGRIPIDLPERKAAADIVPPERERVIETIQAQRHIRRLQLKIDQDSAGIRTVVRMVSPVFQNNPRRLKQFLNTYRLALGITSSQGILSDEPGNEVVTPQQLGKFVALTMHIPEIRNALTGEPALLAILQDAALGKPPDADFPLGEVVAGWLRERSVKALLSADAGLYDHTFDKTSNPFSLKGVDVSKLMSLLPKAPPELFDDPVEPPSSLNPTGSAETETPLELDIEEQAVAEQVRASAPVDPRKAPVTTSAAPTSVGGQAAPSLRSSSNQTGGFANRDVEGVFLSLAAEYERTRRETPSSPDRTITLDLLLNRIQSEARQLTDRSTSALLDLFIRMDTDGARVVALGIVTARIQQSRTDWLLGLLRQFRSRFEHYWTLQALLRHIKVLNAQQAAVLAETLEKLMPELERDSGRYKLARDLQNLAMAASAPA